MDKKFPFPKNSERMVSTAVGLGLLALTLGLITGLSNTIGHFPVSVREGLNLATIAFTAGGNALTLGAIGLNMNRTSS